MWLLTNDGDLFEGKRRWLRPGSTHLLGRTTGRPEGGERLQYINHKSVSRKHLIIEVGTVKPGDSSHLFARSQITLTESSKIGTTLNGERLLKESRTLEGKEYTIKLGSYEHLFHLSWHPVTLSFTSGSKKSKDEAIAQRRAQLESADIKITTDYVTNETTHAITKKRNTPPALQALIQARWVVTEGFADAVVKAVSRQAEPDDLTPLEQDFDANWPSEEGFVVPSAGEPQPRPDSFLKPNRDRMEIFQDYTFVFLTQSQYDTLLPVITAGSGKALLRDVEPSDSTVEDVVEYIREVAGRKGSNQFRLSQLSGKGGVVVVRLNERDGALRKFQQDIDVALDQRSIEQNEFLDAVLTVDASSLRRQLPETLDDVEANGDGEAPELRTQGPKRQRQRAVTVADSPPANHEGAPSQPEQHDNPAAEQPSPATRRRNRRVITQSRFKGFDDFDPSQFSKAASASPELASEEPNFSQAASAQNMDVDDTSQPSRTQANNRKRRAAEHEAQDEEDMYASILTSHAAMKRRKVQAEGGEESAARSVGETDGASTNKVAKGKKKAKEMDVMADVRARREKQEEQRRKDEEYLRDAGEDIDVDEAKKLVKVEEMEMPLRERPVRNANQNAQSERWDPAWNGRKNFKQFRRQGENRDRPRLQRVMVALEEVPRKGHGMGDEYWLTSTASTNKSKSKSQSQSQPHSARTGVSKSQRDTNNIEEEEEEDDITRFRRGLQRSREEDEENDAAERILPEEVAGRPRDEAIQAEINATPTQTFATDSQRKKAAAGKRPATQMAGGPPVKKARSTKGTQDSREVVSLDEDEDDDGLKFRRRAR